MLQKNFVPTLKYKKFKKRICFDIDGVICTNTWGDYDKALPIKQSIKKINSLYKNEHYIMLFTSRYMSLLNGERNKIYEKYYDMTYKQLTNWGLKFHELILCKPEYDIYIDDKNFNYNNDWITSEF